MTIGHMLYQWLTKLEWFSTLFPRIPVPIQKQIETKINNYCREHNVSFANQNTSHAAQNEPDKRIYERRERSIDRKCGGSGRDRSDRSKERQYNRSDERHDARRAYRSRSKEREKQRERNRDKDRHR